MKRLISCVLIASVFMLIVSGVLINSIQRWRQEAQAHDTYYTAILEQAPCIAGICPGFDQGRDHALELLSYSKVVQGVAVGTDIIGLLFTDHKGNIVGSGGIHFAPIDQSIQFMRFDLEHLKLETVFNVLGEPDEFLFVSGCGMGQRVHAELFYLNRGIEVAVEYATRRPGSETLTSSTPVSAIEYFPSADFHNHLLTSLEWYVLDSVAYDLSPTIVNDDFIRQIRPWPGLDTSPTPTADFCPR